MISLHTFEQGIEILRAFEIKGGGSPPREQEEFSICELGLVVEVGLPIEDYSAEDRLLRDLGWQKADDHTYQLPSC